MGKKKKPSGGKKRSLPAWAKKLEMERQRKYTSIEKYCKALTDMEKALDSLEPKCWMYDAEIHEFMNSSLNNFSNSYKSMKPLARINPKVEDLFFKVAKRIQSFTEHLEVMKNNDKLFTPREPFLDESGDPIE